MTRFIVERVKKKPNRIFELGQQTMKSIKPKLNEIRSNLEMTNDKVWDLIDSLNVDPVCGNEQKLETSLAVDLNHLRQYIEQALTEVNCILNYQGKTRVSYNRKK